jgi:hypothetical protein
VNQLNKTHTADEVEQPCQNMSGLCFPPLVSGADAFPRYEPSARDLADSKSTLDTGGSILLYAIPLNCPGAVAQANQIVSQSSVNENSYHPKIIRLVLLHLSASSACGGDFMASVVLDSHQLVGTQAGERCWGVKESWFLGSDPEDGNDMRSDHQA